MKTPREQFQTNKEDMASLEALVDGPFFNRVTTCAMAQFMQSNPSSEMIVGANLFITVLTQLHQQSQQQPEFPIRTLKSFDQTTK